MTGHMGYSMSHLEIKRVLVYFPSPPCRYLLVPFSYVCVPPLSVTLNLLNDYLATQYCDGVRGPLVVYDPQDVYLGDYDVDDGETSYSSSVQTDGFLQKLPS